MAPVIVYQRPQLTVCSNVSVADRNIKVTPFYPGWVQTKLGGEHAPLTVEESAEDFIMV